MQIENHITGAGKPVFIIAEAGVNHNGDLSLAKKLIDAAADAGADAVKFQTFTPKELVSDDAPQAAYQVKNTDKEESQLAMLERLALTHENFAELQQYAKAKGIIFLSTPFSIPDADFLDSLNVPAFKVGSGDLTNLPLLVHLASKGRPIILSTGMAVVEEIKEAIDCIRAGGVSDIVVLQCTTEYPTPLKDVNLRVMQTLRDEFDLPVGFSDHTEGIVITVSSVAAGACVVEKHFTLDRSLPGPDHKASLEPHELTDMVKQIRMVEEAMGSSQKIPSALELETARVARKSIVARRDILVGTTIGADDVYIVRPGTGIEPKHFAEVIGKKSTQAISRGTPLRWEMLS